MEQEPKCELGCLPPTTMAKVAGLLGLLITALLLGTLVVLAEPAPQHDHGSLGVTGDFYAHWTQPPLREASCCSAMDCYDTLFKTEGGTTFALMRKLLSFETADREPIALALEHNRWIVIPQEKLEENTRDPADSPDGFNHVCMNEYGTVFCAVRGGGQ